LRVNLIREINMFGWIKQILSGNHNPDIPNDAKVQRDELGRISQVEVTLGGEKQSQDYPSFSPSESLQDKLNSASDALVSMNIALIQKGVGFEQSYEFVQEENELTLIFEDGRKIIADGEIIGSFDPAARSFLWAWANPTIVLGENSVAQKLHQLGKDTDEKILLEPTQSLQFSQIIELMAYAGQFGELDGVYRAFSNGNVSVFVGYRVQSIQDADGTEIPLGAFAGQINDDEISRAQAHCDAYDAEMLVVDESYQAQGDTVKMDGFLDQKNEIYSRYWTRDDDYWKPCSFGWPSEHDLKDYPIKFSGPGKDEATLIGRIHGYRKTIYEVEFFGDNPKITNQLIEWGDGFIWPN